LLKHAKETLTACVPTCYFKKMEVTDFRNDVLLAEACRDDVDELCNKVKPGRRQLLPDDS